MRSKTILALVLLNLALLGTLFAPNIFTRSAKAQRALPRPSEYLMLSGEVTGGNGGVVFVIDTRNGLLSVLNMNMNAGKIEEMKPIDLNRMFKK